MSPALASSRAPALPPDCDVPCRPYALHLRLWLRVRHRGRFWRMLKRQGHIGELLVLGKDQGSTAEHEPRPALRPRHPWQRSQWMAPIPALSLPHSTLRLGTGGQPPLSSREAHPQAGGSGQAGAGARLPESPLGTSLGSGHFWSLISVPEIPRCFAKKEQGLKGRPERGPSCPASAGLRG